MEIGTDIEQIERFKNKTLENNSHFLNRIFSKAELDYCFKDKNSAQHLCGKFCAKEATIKALNNLGINDIFLSDIEILNKENKIPFIVIKKLPDLKIKVSISHTKNNAIAFVIIEN